MAPGSRAACLQSYLKQVCGAHTAVFLGICGTVQEQVAAFAPIFPIANKEEVVKGLEQWVQAAQGEARLVLDVKRGMLEVRNGDAPVGELKFEDLMQFTKFKRLNCDSNKGTEAEETNLKRAKTTPKDADPCHATPTTEAPSAPTVPATPTSQLPPPTVPASTVPVSTPPQPQANLAVSQSTPPTLPNLNRSNLAAPPDPAKPKKPSASEMLAALRSQVSAKAAQAMSRSGSGKPVSPPKSASSLKERLMKIERLQDFCEEFFEAKGLAFGEISCRQGKLRVCRIDIGGRTVAEASADTWETAREKAAWEAVCHFDKTLAEEWRKAHQGSPASASRRRLW